MTSYNHTPIAVGAPANAGIINNPLGQLDAAIGRLADLDTTAKNNLVDAINEVFAGAEPAQAKNMFKASPATASGVPGYRTIVTADLPLAGTSGTYTKVTTDATGRVVSGTGVDVSDVLNLGTKRLDEWAPPLDSTVLDASTTRHGLMAKYPNTPNNVLIGDGTWSPWAMGVQNNANLLTARKYLNIFGNGVSVIDRGAWLDRIDVNIAGATAIGLGKPFFLKQTEILAEIDYEDGSSPISVVTNPSPMSVPTNPYYGTLVSEFYTNSALKWLGIMPAGGFSCYMKGSIASNDPGGRFIIIIDAVDNVGATLGTVGTIIVPVTVTTEEWFYGGGSVDLTDFGADFDRLRITVYASSGITNTMTLETNLGCSYIVTTYRNIGEKGDTGVTGATGVASVFTDLTDVPAAYTGDGGKYVKVNATEDGLEFDTPAGSSDMTKAVYDTNDDGSVDKADAIDGIAAAGNSKYYGTNASGTPGFYDLPSGSGGGTHDTIFTFVGDLEVGNHPLKIHNKLGSTQTISQVFLSCGTAPTGADIIVDIHKNGTTIFTTQTNRPRIAAGNTEGYSTTIEVSSWADGDYLTAHIDQIGSGTAGANLVVHVIHS